MVHKRMTHLETCDATLSSALLHTFNSTARVGAGLDSRRGMLNDELPLIAGGMTEADLVVVATVSSNEERSKVQIQGSCRAVLG
jgi:hypothetical protein